MMIDPVTFNKVTNEYNVPFARISKTAEDDKKKKLKLRLNRNQDPFTNTIGSNPTFTEANILNPDIDKFERDINKLNELNENIKNLEDEEDEFNQNLFNTEKKRFLVKREAFNQFEFDKRKRPDDDFESTEERVELQNKEEGNRGRDTERGLAISRERGREKGVEDTEKEQELKRKETAKFVTKNLKKFTDLMNKPRKGEKMPKGIFDKGRMIETSYVIQQAQTTEDLVEAKQDFEFNLVDSNYEFMPQLSNRNSAVFYNAKPKDGGSKWTVAYHGANGMEGVDKQNIKDVINGNFERNPEYLESKAQLEELLNHLDSQGFNVGEDVELVGYSLGGSKSLMLAEKFNLKGTHYNAFINPLISHELADVSKEALKRQSMIRVITDPTTLQSIVPPPRAHNRRYSHILPLADNKTHLDSHNLDQITQKKPRGIEHMVEGKRNLKGEAIGHAGTVLGGVVGGYMGFREGRDNSGDVSEELYRGFLGAGESTLPIVGEADVLESGLVGFTPEEVSNSFNWFENIFRKKKEPEKNKVPPGYVEVFESGRNLKTPEDFKNFEDGNNVDVTLDNLINDLAKNK